MCFVPSHVTLPYYDLKIVSECLRSRTTLRRFKIAGGGGGGGGLGMPPDCVFVSCQRSARRKSSMTVTCVHTGHFHTMTSFCLRVPQNHSEKALRGGGGGGGGMP